MKVLIEIPKEFEEHFNNDRFKDSFERVRADIQYHEIFLSGNYEMELVQMLQNVMEKAENYANNEINKIFVDESEEVYVRASTLKQIIKNSHLKGLAEGRKEKWHDLRKNPNDLPKENGEYWCKWEDGSYSTGHYFQDNGFGDHVIAWCELPKFEE